MKELDHAMVVEHLADAVVVADGRGVVTSVNHAAELDLSVRLRVLSEVAARMEPQHGVTHLGHMVADAVIDTWSATAVQVWLADPDAGLSLCAHAGVDPAGVPTDPSAVVAEVARARRAVVTGGDEAPADDCGDGSPATECAVAVLPLLSGDACEGVLRCRFDNGVPGDLTSVLPAFASVVGTKLGTARLHQQAHEAQQRSEAARRESEAARERADLLRASSQILISTLDYGEALERLTDLAVQNSAEWCAVAILDAEGRLRRSAIAHHDPDRWELARELVRRYPLLPDAPVGATRVVRTGITDAVPVVPDAFLAAYGRQPGHLEILRALGLGSFIAVPLISRGRTIGAMTCYFSDSGGSFSDTEVQIVEGLGQAAAVAVDNARLIAELERANATKAASLYELDALFRTAPIGLSMLDRELRHVRVNDALATMLGHDVDDLVGRTPVEVLPDAYAEAQELFAEVLRTGRAIHGREVSVHGPGGDHRDLRVSYYPVPDADGEPVAVGGIIEDITQRQRMARELDREREFLTTTLENLRDGIVGCDAVGNLTVFNRAAEECHGRPARSMPPEQWPEWYQLFLPDGVTRMTPDQVPLFRALRGELVRNVEMVIAHPHGERRVVLCNGQALHDSQGDKIGAVVAIHDVTQRKEAEDRLTRQALHDPLTGLPNRALLLDRMEQALARTERRDGSVAVLFLDFDRFKNVNDSLGHDVGDRVLIAIAERLTTAVRPSDTVARLGGDEFVVLCEGLEGRGDAVQLVERLQDAIAAAPLLDADEAEIVMTASIGVAMADGDQRTPTLLQNADAAMYRAKELGKDRYAFFDDSFQVAAVDRLRTETSLRRAIDGDRLRLVYQPVIDLRKGTIIGTEALLRYHDPDRGLVPPSEFLDVAEDTGLIVPIGSWVIGEACRQVAQWRRIPGTEELLQVAVNLSARQLAAPGLVDTLEQALAEEQLPPSAVSLEITESVLFEAAGSTLRMLDRLRSVGSHLGIDDFGTGYSSLTYLRRFPVDFLKLDQSFVEGLGTDPEDTAIVTAVIGLASSLRLATVAEGVETADQLSLLRELNCDRAQGYYFARPQDADGIRALLARQPSW